MKTLVYDIGNTQIKMGVFEDTRLLKSWRLTTGTAKTSDEYGVEVVMLLKLAGIEPESLDCVAVASVVPAIMSSFCNGIRRYLGKEPLLIGPGIKTGVKLKVPHPKEVGADLIADVVAASKLYGGPCIVVDFGTATKYLVIDEEGAMIAAIFTPGIGISAEVLTGKAAQLPGFEIRKPKSILTNETVECMQAGIVYGAIGQVKYIVEQIRLEMGDPDMKVIATGGFGRLMVPELSCISEYNSTLILDGIRMLAEMNRPRRKHKAATYGAVGEEEND